jgi:hypothetical protein
VFILPVIGIALVTCVAVVVGFICLIIPGLFLLTIWSMATPAAVFERLDIGRSLERSAKLTEGYRWYVFGIGAVFFGACFLIQGAFDGGHHHHHIEDFGDYFSNVSHAVRRLIRTILDVVAAPIGAMLTASTYYELRMIKEGAGPEALAEVLD